MPIYLEDLHVGDVKQLGSHTMTKDAILAFARQFDPQPLHLDEEAARASVYGGLIASGWHTASITMRLLVDGFINQTVSMGSPGIDELRWLVPVRADDTLTLRVRILEVRPSQKKPDRGSIRAGYEVFNQKGELVMTMVGLGILARRP